MATCSQDEVDRVLYRTRQIIREAALQGSCLTITEALSKDERAWAITPENFELLKTISSNDEVSCCLHGAVFLACVREKLTFDQYRKLVSSFAHELNGGDELHGYSDGLVMRATGKKLPPSTFLVEAVDRLIKTQRKVAA